MSTRAIIFLSILIGLFFYTCFKAVQLLPNHRFIAWFGTVFLFFMMLGSHFIYRAGLLSMDSLFFTIFFWAGSVMLGIWVTFIFISIPFDVVQLGLVAFQKIQGTETVDLERRQVLARWLPTAILGISGGLAALGLKEVLSGPQIKEVSLPAKEISDKLAGLKIVQISDLHVGPTVRRSYVEAVAQKVMSLKPDLIAVTGDLVDGKVEELHRHVEPLSRLKAPLGVYFVTGNHEYYSGVEPWLQKVAELGFTNLLNENKIVSFNGASILVGGVPDTSGDQFLTSHVSDPQRAIVSEKESAFKILLAHRPGSCFEAEKAGFDLMLSGHTHSGQFFPFSLIIRFFHPYYRGLNRHKKMWVYVNQGTGYWGPANRFALPAEITFLRLV